MPPQLNLAADITAYILAIYEDALMVARDNNLMSSLITTFSDRTGIADRKNSEYNSANIRSVAEGDDLTSDAFTPSVIATLTPGEVGAQFFLSDTRVESDPFAVRNDAALELGMATAEKIDVDALSHFPSLTGGTVGAAGTVITWGHFFAMLSVLRTQRAPRPYYFVCHPYHWHQLGKAASIAGAANTPAPEFQNEVMRNFYVQTVSGVSVFVTSNLVIDGNADAPCGMFSPTSQALDMRRAPRLEPERDASRRGWELNMSTVYATGVWRPKFGIQGLFDATAPTS